MSFCASNTLPDFSIRHDFKIIGGVEATRNEFPWMIRIQSKRTGRLICGGTIIDSNAILTAARM